MQFKLPLFWIALFVIGFSLSLTLGLVSQIPFGVVFMRAMIAASFLSVVAGLVYFIFNQYLAEAINLSSIISPSPVSEESDFVHSMQDEKLPTVSESPPDSANSEESSSTWGSSGLKDSSFKQLGQEVAWKDEKEGLTKVTKNSFREEDPAVMAETIRTAIVQEGKARTSVAGKE